MLLALHTAAASTGLVLGDEPQRLAAAGLLAVVGIRYLLLERRCTDGTRATVAAVPGSDGGGGSSPRSES